MKDITANVSSNRSSVRGSLISHESTHVIPQVWLSNSQFPITARHKPDTYNNSHSYTMLTNFTKVIFNNIICIPIYVSKSRSFIFFTTSITLVFFINLFHNDPFLIRILLVHLEQSSGLPVGSLTLNSIDAAGLSNSTLHPKQLYVSTNLDSP